VGQTALTVAQQTLHLLPIPVVGLEPGGMVVLRNEAFGKLGVDEDSLSALAQQLPPWPSTEVGDVDYVSNGGQSSGVVFAFLLRESA
jgi:hypothetical protein